MEVPPDAEGCIRRPVLFLELGLLSGSGPEVKLDPAFIIGPVELGQVGLQVKLRTTVFVEQPECCD